MVVELLSKNIITRFISRNRVNGIYKANYGNDNDTVLDLYQNDEEDVFKTNVLKSQLYDFSKLLFNIFKDEENIYKKCKLVRDEYMLMLKLNGNTNVNSDDIFKYYPINVSKKMNLLAEYICNTIYCQCLESGEDEFKNNLVIKLNSKSSNKDINILRNFMKKENCFKNLVLIFDYDTTKRINFLSLKGIQYENTEKIITVEDDEWLNIVQNAYMQLFLIHTHFHTYWHLLTAYIVNMAKYRLTNKDNNLLKLFEIANNESEFDDIFIKALEVKEILFKTPIVFNTTLYNNKKYIEFTNNWINNFIKDFDIDTFYKKNITRKLNTDNHRWIVGFKENLYEIKQYTNAIMNKTKTKNMDINKYNILSNEYNNNAVINYSTEKLLQILMVVGGLLHSQTYVYQKTVFTDIIRLDSEIKYLVLMNTICYSPNFNVYGDLELYTHNKYKKEYIKFNERVLLLKQKTEKDEKKNTIFRSFVYCSKNINEKYMAIFTQQTVI
jgi:hypothetical protein